MSQDKKLQVQPTDLGDFDVKVEIGPDVTYLPCSFCGSRDYDYFNGDVNEETLCLMPENCDQCGMGNVSKSHLTLH